MNKKHTIQKGESRGDYARRVIPILIDDEDMSGIDAAQKCRKLFDEQQAEQLKTKKPGWDK